MKLMDRRKFLFGAFSSNQASNAFASTPPGLAVMPNADLGPVEIGNISRFPLGGERVAGSGTVMVESFPEGLRARSYSLGFTKGGVTRYLAIRSNASGGLIVDRSETWPADRVYSLLTGEPARLNSILEDQV